MSRIVILLLVVLFSPITSSASENKNLYFVVDFGLGSFRGMGYKFPVYDFGAGIDIRFKKLNFESLFLFSPTDKYGYKITRYALENRLIYDFNPLIISGGATYNHLKFDGTTSIKKTIRPFIGSGLKNNRSQFLVEYVLSGNDRYNHVSGPRVKFLFVLGKTRLKVGGYWYSFDASTLHPERGRIKSFSYDFHINLLF